MSPLLKNDVKIKVKYKQTYELKEFNSPRDIRCIRNAGLSTNEQEHDKINKMSCVPSKSSDQPGHPPSLISAFSVCMKKPWMPRLIWVFAGCTGQCVGFVMLWLICTKLSISDGWKFIFTVPVNSLLCPSSCYGWDQIPLGMVHTSVEK